MAKIIKFVFLLSLSFCFSLALYEKEFADFDKNFATSKEKIQFHHQFQNLYIQSIISENDADKTELLKRLIISSNALNLDDSIYVKELKAQNFSQSQIQALKLGKLSLNEKNIAQNTKQENTQKTLFVLQAYKQDYALVLKLSGNLTQKDLAVSELIQKDNYRYIVDFKAALDTGRKEFDFGAIKLLLAQFNTQTTRLVLMAKQKPKFEFDFKEKELKIILQKPQAKQEALKTQNNTKKTKPLYILKNTKENNGIRLTLSEDFDENELKIFRLKDKNIHRLVLNFEAVLEGGRKNYDFGKNYTLTLSQYSPKIVRVVLNAPSEVMLEKKISNKSLFLGFENLKIQAQNTLAQKNSPTNNNKVLKNLNTNKIIVIDAGHGGKDGGAVGGEGKWLEKNVVLAVSLKLGNELKNMGYKVFYTRTNDKFINLKDRTAIANQKKANLFISIHANAAPNAKKAKDMQGIESFFLSPARSERSKEVAAKENQTDLAETNFFSRQNFLGALSREKIIASNRLAIDIQKNLLSSVRSRFKVVDGGVREAPFWVLVGAQDMPAVLIELGYITHPEEGKRLVNKDYQELLAKGIANGVQNYFMNNP